MFKEPIGRRQLEAGNRRTWKVPLQQIKRVTGRNGLGENERVTILTADFITSRLVNG